jgi:cyclic pyranopterin phosphate synthase
MLIDPFNRVIDYLRISVTDRCNLRCSYCMPEEGMLFHESTALLSWKELTRIVRLAVDEGVKKIRITGGEPTVRSGLVDWIQEIGENPRLQSIAMTTNGLLLERYLPALWKAGLRKLNISLDTLSREKFRVLTRFDKFQTVIHSIQTAEEMGFRIKLNAVLLRGINDDEVADFVALTKEHGYDFRFIEFMPFRNNEWNEEQFMPVAELRETILRTFPLEKINDDHNNGPARSYRVPGFKGKISFISQITEHFCDHCNRFRLSNDGFFKSCLLTEGQVDVKTPLRRGASDEEIRRIIRLAVELKPKEHPYLIQEMQKNNFTMSQLGG